jgi:hypothetical protein
VNCRTRRALEFRTHIAAPVFTYRSLVCLRVGKIINHNTGWFVISAKGSRPTLVCLLVLDDERYRSRRHLRSRSLSILIQSNWNTDPTDIILYFIVLCHIIIFILCRPQIKRDYPLNLSILFSGGKETKRDFPSNGE